MVSVAQQVAAPGCGLGGRGFEPLHSPHADKKARILTVRAFFVFYPGRRRDAIFVVKYALCV